MAFSTQRAFQHVPFSNEYPHPICLPMQGIKIQTFGSARDERAWSINDNKKTQYLIDLVSCRIYVDDDAEDGVEENQEKNRTYRSIKDPVAQIFPKDNSKKVDELVDAVRAEKDDLQLRLNESQEKLKVLEQQNKALSAAISPSRTDGPPPNELFDQMRRKINQLRKLSKIDKNDENELLQMLDGLSKTKKADEGTNKDKLKGLEKRNQNADQNQKILKDSESFESIKAERNALREKCESFASVEGKIIEWKNDAEKLKHFKKKACIALQQKDERLREYCERIEELEYEFRENIKCFKIKEQEREQVCALYNSLKEENQVLKEELCRCNSNLKGITTLQNQIQLLSRELCDKNCVIEHYDIQFQELLGVIEGLQSKVSNADNRSVHDSVSQTQNTENIEELAATTRATLDQISKELEQRQELESELAQSIANLETVRRESEEKEKEMVAKLNEKEMENQKLLENLQRTNATVKESLEQLNIEVKSDEDCLAEVARLNEFITKLRSEHANEIQILKNKSNDLQRDFDLEKSKLSDSEKFSGEATKDLMAELTAAQDENRQLKKQNKDLNDALKECENKVKAQKEEIKKLDQRTTELLTVSEASLKEVGKLVNDISNVQDRNENLKTVLNAVDYSDKCKQEIENLKKLLDDEKIKNKNLTEDKMALVRDLDQAKETINTQKQKLIDNENTILKIKSEQIKEQDQVPQKTVKLNNEEKKALHKDPVQVNKNTPTTSSDEKTVRTTPKASDDQGISSKDKTFKTTPKASDDQGISSEDKTFRNTPKASDDQGISSEDKTLRTTPKASDDQRTDSRRVRRSASKASNEQRTDSQQKRRSTSKASIEQRTDSQQKRRSISKASIEQRTDSQQKRRSASKASNEQRRDPQQKLRSTSKASIEQRRDPQQKLRSTSKPSDTSVAQLGSSRDKKSSTKLTQLQKLHEATRNAERQFYEKEIEGHRMSNELLKKSLTKLTSKVKNSSAAEFEKEMRLVLDNFVIEISKWRSEKNFKKLSKLQEICKRILEYGIHCLSYKELVYLHQRMSEAALRLKPNCLSSTTTTTTTTTSTNSSKELMCCKRAEKVCDIPSISK
ncbi:putative autophagy-related protein 11 [Eupeodes corollae]|uniref:putative autophagy-related protein 11 n=1 Tax=Eupeodes corollae TaxID=290404 RepID=UPI002491D8BB|nr:putative autophagy-related protein 11 [Eupeodes corollae]